MCLVARFDCCLLGFVMFSSGPCCTYTVQLLLKTEPFVLPGGLFPGILEASVILGEQIPEGRAHLVPPCTKSRHTYFFIAPHFQTARCLWLYSLLSYFLELLSLLMRTFRAAIHLGRPPGSCTHKNPGCSISCRL